MTVAMPGTDSLRGRRAGRHGKEEHREVRPPGTTGVARSVSGAETPARSTALRCRRASRHRRQSRRRAPSRTDVGTDVGRRASSGRRSARTMRSPAPPRRSSRGHQQRRGSREAGLVIGIEALRAWPMWLGISSRSWRRRSGAVGPAPPPVVRDMEGALSARVLTVLLPVRHRPRSGTAATFPWRR